MTVIPLNWDSDFFGLRIARVNIQSQDCRLRLYDKKKELKQQYDLIYLFCAENLRFDDESADLVDRKLIYTKQIEIYNSVSANVQEYLEDVPTDDLYNLSIISGGYSRFKLDKNFPDGSFEKLYRCWIEQSVNHRYADVVLCYRDNTKIVGMVTLKIDKDTSSANIGLVAVDNDCQSKGYGTQLLNAVNNYLLKNHIVTLDVATQFDNKRACAWYEKNDFKKKSLTNIYHWWLN